MKARYQKFLKHVFLYTVSALVIIVAIISYFRFIVNHDYIVGYEGVCDTEKNICFTKCEDDTCTKEYYYSKVKKYARDLYKECGANITDCESANTCLEGDRDCSVIYCDPQTSASTCSILNKKNIQNEENILQKNNIKNTK